MENERKTITLPISGMHCGACSILVADTLSEELHVTARADLVKAVVQVEGFSGTLEELVSLGNQFLKPIGYVLGEKPGLKWKGIFLGFAGAAGILVLISLVQNLGLFGPFMIEEIHPESAFLLGLVASVSTCFALVGGLLVTYAGSMKDFDMPVQRWNMGLFHLGRFGGFFLLGGVLGWVGDILQVDYTMTVVMLSLAALIMIIAGLQFLGIVRLPQSNGRVTSWVKDVSRKSGPVFGLLLGILTFFLPCGFTQSTQFQAIATGNFWDGAVLMFSFALGSFPVLGGISLTLGRGLKGKLSGALTKGSGFLILGLGFFQAYAALTALGWLTPIYF